MVVVLPAPFGPSSPNDSPAATENETPRTASTSPKRTTRSLTTHGVRHRATQLLAPRAQGCGRLRREANELLALVRLERGEDVAEELEPPLRHLGGEPRAGGGQHDLGRAAVVGVAPSACDARGLEPVGEPRRGRLVDAHPRGELADAKPAVGERIERAELRRREPRVGAQRREQPAAGEDPAERAPVARELGCEGRLRHYLHYTGICQCAESTTTGISREVRASYFA